MAKLLKNVFLSSFVIFIALLQVGCENPRDIVVHISEQNQIDGISVSYTLARDGAIKYSKIHQWI